MAVAKKFSPRDLCLVYSEADPRVSSIRVAERLHPSNLINRNSKIAAFIERNRDELERYGNISRRGSYSGKRGQPAIEYLLNEDQVTIVCMRSDSNESADARFEIIQLIRAYRRGEIPQSSITIIADLFDPRPATITPLIDNVTQIAFEKSKTANERHLDAICGDLPRNKGRRWTPLPPLDPEAEAQRLAEWYGLPAPEQTWQEHHNDVSYDCSIICEQGPPFVRIKPTEHDGGDRVHLYLPMSRWTTPQVLLRMEPYVPLEIVLKAFSSERLGPLTPVVKETLQHLLDIDPEFRNAAWIMATRERFI
jgi:hypothetical protein